MKYISPVASFRQFYPMKGLRINREGRNVLGIRLQLAHVNGLRRRSRSAHQPHLRWRRVRHSRLRHPRRIALHLRPGQGAVQPDQSRRHDGSARSDQPKPRATFEIPLPIYRLVAIGGDTQLTSNVEYRIPIVNQVTFALFTDFGLTGDLDQDQLRQSVAGASVLSSPLYGCPTFVNGACYGGKAVPGFSPLQLNTVPFTNFVPRMSSGAEIQVILPIVNAPFRLYYAYNPLRLYRDVPQQLARG